MHVHLRAILKRPQRLTFLVKLPNENYYSFPCNCTADLTMSLAASKACVLLIPEQSKTIAPRNLRSRSSCLVDKARTLIAAPEIWNQNVRTQQDGKEQLVSVRRGANTIFSSEATSVL